MEIPLLDSWWPLYLIICITLVYVYETWTYDYWKKRDIPYVKPLPFFGNIRDVILSKKCMGEVYEDLYWELDPHPYGGIFKFRQPTILIRDPELVKTILVKDFPSFQENDLQVDVNVDPLLGRNPIVLGGEKWKTTRSRITPAFTSGKLKPIFPLVEEVCEELKKCVENLERTEDGVDVKELCARYTTDVVATCAYGIKCNSLKDPECEFRKMGRAMVQPDSWSNLKMLIVFLLPQIAYLLRIRLVPKKVHKFFDRIVNETIAYRDKNKACRNDFIQLLIDIRNRCSSTTPRENDFTETDIAAQAVTFFTDGFETSSLALSFVLYELALHPDIQEKLRAEVEKVMNKHGGRLTYDGIQEMEYLDMVFSESQRAHPLLYVMMKKCTQPFDLKTPSGRTYRVEVGTPVQIPIYSLHHDPKYFPEPEWFDPERFSEENKRNIPKYAYLPFGEGPRICIGMRFALMQVKAAIATLVKHFEIRATKRTAREVVLDPNYFLNYIQGGIWLDFVKRD